MAEKKGFDLSSFFSAVSNSDTIDQFAREQIEYIDIDLIDDDPNNFYALIDLEELASNIQLCGLQQPIRVRAGAGGRVTIVSGHRRRSALRLLISEGLDQFRSVPCIRERETGSAALQELKLIYANSDTRTLTSAEISKQAERVEMLFYQLKEEGYEFPGRMRDHVAEACKVSKSKLARLKVIREKLIPAYKTMFDEGKLVEQAAYALAGMPSEFQERCAKVLKGPVQGYCVEKVREKFGSGCSYEPTFNCPDGSPCHHGDAFLRHDLKCSWDHCGGKTCCLECRQAFANYSACDSACSKVKAKRKEQADKDKLQSQKEEQRKMKESEKTIETSSEYLQRMQSAADKAGITINKKFLESLGIVYYEADHLLALISGQHQAAPHYDSRSYLPRAHAIAEFCRKTGCSADYILGLAVD